MHSYERQGLDILPTVHMEAAVSALERKCIETNIGNLNRDMKAANRMMNAIRSTIRNLRNWIADIMEATKEAFLLLGTLQHPICPINRTFQDVVACCVKSISMKQNMEL